MSGTGYRRGTPGCPDPPAGVECPYIGARPRVQWRRPPGGRICGAKRPDLPDIQRVFEGSLACGRCGRATGSRQETTQTVKLGAGSAPIGTEKPLAARRRNLGAVMPSHQHAILGLAQIGDAHRQPYADRCQRDGEGEGGDVRQHAMPEIVRLLAGLARTATDPRSDYPAAAAGHPVDASRLSGWPGGCARVRGRNLSTRCSSSDAMGCDVMGCRVFTAASSGKDLSRLARLRCVSQKMLPENFTWPCGHRPPGPAAVARGRCRIAVDCL